MLKNNPSKEHPMLKKKIGDVFGTYHPYISNLSKNTTNTLNSLSNRTSFYALTISNKILKTADRNSVGLFIHGILLLLLLL